jgi:hypothetical protein
MKKILYFLLFVPIFAHSQNLIRAYDFESATGFTPSSSGLWDLGIPVNNVINTSNSGNFCWITDQQSSYSGADTSYLFSPPIAIHPYDSGFISFYHFLDLDTSTIPQHDLCNIDIREIGASVWMPMGYAMYPGSVNWYNVNSNGKFGWNSDSTGWQYSSFPFNRNQHYSVFYGLDTVEFRFSFMSFNGHSGDGWALDDFKVWAWNMPVDLGVEEILSPDTTFDSDNVDLVFKLKNYGLSAINSATCYISVDSVLVDSAQISMSNGLAPDSVMVVSLSDVFNAPERDYELLISCLVPGDPVISNNFQRKMISAKHGAKDLKIIQVDVDPSVVVNNRRYTCYFRASTISIHAINIGSDTLTQVKFYYQIYNYLKESNQNVLVAPNDTLHFTFSQHFQNYHLSWQYFLYSGIEIMYPGYLYEDTFSLHLHHVSMMSKSDTISMDSLANWCPVVGSVGKINFLNQINTFPNPTSNQITLDLSPIEDRKDLSLVINNAALKELDRLQISQQRQVSVDLSYYPAGMYIIQVFQGDKLLGVSRVVRE